VRLFIIKTIYKPFKKLEIMARDLRITGREWLELVFANKNKTYGAYALRITGTRRHLTAYAAVALLAAAIVIFPTLKNRMTPADGKKGVTEATVLSSVVLTPPPVEAVVAPRVAAPPTAALRPTIRFVVPRIVAEPAATDEAPPPVMDELLRDPSAGISVVTQQGEPAGTADPTEFMPGAPAGATDEPILAQVVEQPAVFTEDFMAWIYKELKYPVAAIERDIAGRVTVQFTVGKDGKVGDVKVLKGVDALLDREAVRVLNKMPDWIPGKQQGEPVAVRFVIPIIFRLGKR
jgi:protein TonB